MSDDRAITYKDSPTGPVIYRVSALSMGCETCLVASRLGYDPLPHSEETLANFEKGNTAEPIILDWMREHGWTITGTQSEIDIPILPNIILRGHNDGIGVGPNELDQPELIECKWMGPSVYKKWVNKGWAGFPNYELQSDIYCHGLSLSHKRIAIATSPLDDGDELLVVVGDSTPIRNTLGNIRKRILAIEQWVKREEVPTISPHFPCPFYYLREDKDKVEVTTNREISDLIERIAYNQFEAAATKKALDLMKTELMRLMDAGKLDKCKSTAGTATIVTGTRVDYTKVVKDYGVDTDKYRVPNKPYVKVTGSGSPTAVQQTESSAAESE